MPRKLLPTTFRVSRERLSGFRFSVSYKAGCWGEREGRGGKEGRNEKQGTSFSLSSKLLNVTR